MIGGLLDPNPMMMDYELEAFSLFQPQPPISSPSSFPTNVRKRNASAFPSEFAPGQHDVICQRGKDCNDHGKSLSAMYLYMLAYAGAIRSNCCPSSISSSYQCQLATGDSELLLIIMWNATSTLRRGKTSRW